jgi:hypothetical protein
LQFSIEHPCFSPPHRKTLRDEAGRAYARSLQRCCGAVVQGSPQGREAHRDVFEKQLRELGT